MGPPGALLLLLLLLLPAVAAVAPHASGGPCDIFAEGGSPCVAAHSVVRALSSSYDGPLYQIVRTADKKSLNISTLSAGGYANAAAQVAFCDAEAAAAAPQPAGSGGGGGTLPPGCQNWSPGPCCAKRLSCLSGETNASYHPGCVGCAACPPPTKAPNLAACMITRIFDQTTNGNHLHVIGEPSGLEPVGTGGRLHAGSPITGTNASADPLFVDGHAVYSAYFEGGMGFRNQDTTGVPTGDEPETLYMVTSGKHYGGACCFDYGNAEVGLYPNTTNNLTYAKGLMECIYFGDGYGAGGPNSNPPRTGAQVMADLEMGVYGGIKMSTSYAANLTFVTAMVKGDSDNHWSIKWGDAQAGPLHTAFDGPRPSPEYNPMKKPGGLILGLGGDTSPGGVGTFYEGVVTKGYSTDAADAAVQANIVAARYGSQ